MWRDGARIDDRTPAEIPALAQMIPTSDPELRSAPRRAVFGIVPAAVLVLLIAVFAVPFAAIPFPFIDLYWNLLAAESLSWNETLRDAFGAGVEYRPLLTIAIKVAYQTIGLDLWRYKLLILLQFAGILGLMLWMFRPTGWARVTAAVISMLCIAGLHSSRILFNFNPLNAHSGVLLIVVAGAAAGFTPWARRWEYMWFPVTLCAALALESGLLLVPVLIALWLARAPGVTIRGVAAALVAVAVYAVVHLWLGRSLDAGAAYTHSGLGFSAATPERLEATFGRWPWLFWFYNVVATLFTVAFSEPREGTYAFIDSILRGTTPTWKWLHVISSLVTTAIIVLAFPRRNMTLRDRWVTATAIGLIVGGSALGFLYTRDRIALPVGIGYSMLVYVTLSALLGKPRVARGRMVIGTVASLLAAVWLVRDAEMYWFLRDLAWEHHREWSIRYESLRNNEPETDLVRVLRALALRRTPEDPTTSPPWTHQLLERKFGPSSD
jgi:hypothetical protein